MPIKLCLNAGKYGSNLPNLRKNSWKSIKRVLAGCACVTKGAPGSSFLIDLQAVGMRLKCSIIFVPNNKGHGGLMPHSAAVLHRNRIANGPHRGAVESERRPSTKLPHHLSIMTRKALLPLNCSTNVSQQETSQLRV